MSTTDTIPTYGIGLSSRTVEFEFDVGPWSGDGSEEYVELLLRTFNGPMPIMNGPGPGRGFVDTHAQPTGATLVKFKKVVGPDGVRLVGTIQAEIEVCASNGKIVSVLFRSRPFLEGFTNQSIETVRKVLEKEIVQNPGGDRAAALNNLNDTYPPRNQ